MAQRLTDEEIKLLKSEALKAQRNALCHFSNFGVGCAILLNDGRFIKGFNIESSAFPVTICAERVALVSALSQYGVKKENFKAVGIFTNSPKVGSPCGSCRQLLSEYMPLETPVFMFNGLGPEAESTLNELLPYAFEKENLIK